MECTWCVRPFAGRSGLGALASEQTDQCLSECIQRVDVPALTVSDVALRRLQMEILPVCRSSLAAWRKLTHPFRSSAVESR